MFNTHRMLLLLSLPLFLMNIYCSKNGYLKVCNQSNALIEGVRWGNVIELGPIEVGQEAGKETDHHESLRIYFKKNGEEFVSKRLYTVDANTSATYIHKDSSDAENAD
jgi:hypothetical protein